MDSPVRKMLKRNDYARHKLLRKIKRLRKAKLELESHAAEKQLRKKLKIPKFDMGLNPENENDQSTRIETRKNGYLRMRGKRVVPHPKNREDDAKAYDESKKLLNLRLTVKTINDTKSYIDAINSKLDLKQQADYYHQKAMNVQSLLDLMSNVPITELEVQQAASDQVLRKQDEFKQNKYYAGLILKSVGALADGYFLKRGLSNYLLEREFNSLDERLLNMSYNGYTTSDPYFKALSDRHANLLYKLMLPDYKQMTAGAIGSASNIGQIITGNGDFIDYLGLGGGAFGMLGGSLVLRRLGMRGVLADNIVDNLGYGLTGIDFTKTLGELGYEGYNTYFNLK